MRASDLRLLISYTRWANDQVLAACEKVSLEDFVREVSPDPGWKSLRGTLVHALDTAYGWRTALAAIEDDGVIDEASFPDAASLRQRWDAEMHAWIEYLATVTDEDLDAVWWSEGGSSRTRWQTIMHVVNDVTHHRSEAAAMVTGFGCSPGELDLDRYVVDVATR